VRALSDYFISNAPTGCNLCGSGYAIGGQYSFVDTLPVRTSVAKLEVLDLSGACGINSSTVLLNGTPVLSAPVQFTDCYCDMCNRGDVDAVNAPTTLAS
jgi:hypothetical protein